MNSCDGGIGQITIEFRIQCNNSGIIPFGDLGVVDVNEGLAIEHESRNFGISSEFFGPGQIVNGHNCASEHGVHLQVFTRGVLFVFQE
ncbi:hypothetical protein SDC9_127706 [bioreactor metagenome]|uniref:Uncharacterized protein n=1 Tax=bioreactor metagenome TaxID=1076179 RepID=A0A645CU62_9ZZZZ